MHLEFTKVQYSMPSGFGGRKQKKKKKAMVGFRVGRGPKHYKLFTFPDSKGIPWVQKTEEGALFISILFVSSSISF